MRYYQCENFILDFKECCLCVFPVTINDVIYKSSNNKFTDIEPVITTSDNNKINFSTFKEIKEESPKIIINHFRNIHYGSGILNKVYDYNYGSNRFGPFEITSDGPNYDKIYNDIENELNVGYKIIDYIQEEKYNKKENITEEFKKFFYPYILQGVDCEDDFHDLNSTFKLIRSFIDIYNSINNHLSDNQDEKINIFIENFGNKYYDELNIYNPNTMKYLPDIPDDIIKKYNNFDYPINIFVRGNYGEYYRKELSDNKNNLTKIKNFLTDMYKYLNDKKKYMIFVDVIGVIGVSLFIQKKYQDRVNIINCTSGYVQVVNEELIPKTCEYKDNLNDLIDNYRGYNLCKEFFGHITREYDLINFFRKNKDNYEMNKRKNYLIFGAAHNFEQYNTILKDIKFITLNNTNFEDNSDFTINNIKKTFEKTLKYETKIKEKYIKIIDELKNDLQANE
jgi:hypothetical protein